MKNRFRMERRIDEHALLKTIVFRKMPILRLKKQKCPKIRKNLPLKKGKSWCIVVSVYGQGAGVAPDKHIRVETFVSCERTDMVRIVQLRVWYTVSGYAFEGLLRKHSSLQSFVNRRNEMAFDVYGIGLM